MIMIMIMLMIMIMTNQQKRSIMVNHYATFSSSTPFPYISSDSFVKFWTLPNVIIPSQHPSSLHNIPHPLPTSLILSQHPPSPPNIPHPLPTSSIPCSPILEAFILVTGVSSLRGIVVHVVTLLCWQHYTPCVIVLHSRGRRALDG